MITFFGAPMSSSGRTHWMLEEVGVPYEYVRTSPYDGGTRRPEFLALHPAGRIPLIVDGELTLNESVAINFYLAERYAPALWSAELAERALLYRWSLWAITNLQPEVMDVMFNVSLKPEAERDPRAAEAGRVEAGKCLAELDAQLVDRTYLVGERFTVADVNAGSVVNIARALGLLLGANVSAWLDRLRARPAYQRAAAA